jgi:type II secretory pathway component PulC
LVVSVVAAVTAAACGTPEPAAPSASTGAEGTAPAAPPEPVVATPSAPEPTEPPPLPARVDAGSLQRTRVLAVLQEGAGRFLQKLKTEPHFESGKFVGWRLVRMFDAEPEMRGEVLRPGDTLMRVNGQSIERPEEFLHVWQEMRTSGELVLHVRRAGHDSTVRYTITD